MGWIKNISSSGVLFAPAVPVRVGDRVEYFITFSKAWRSRIEVRLRCVDRVVRSQTPVTFAATIDHYEFVRSTMS